MSSDNFKLLCESSSKEEGWVKTTKAMEINGSGCVILVSTRQMNPDGSFAIAEALTFVPNVCVVDADDGNRKLESFNISDSVMEMLVQMREMISPTSEEMKD